MNERMPLQFQYTGRVIDADGNVLEERTWHNLIPQVGINLFAGYLMGTTALISTWYTGVYQGNYTPSNATTAADLPSNAVEALGYSQSTRPAWTPSYDGFSVVSSDSNVATFTFPAPVTLYGGFLISQNTKGGNSGTLLSIARFPSPFSVPAGSTFELSVSIALVSV